MASPKRKTIKQYQNDRLKDKKPNIVIEKKKKMSANEYFHFEICNYILKIFEDMEYTSWVNARKKYYADVVAKKFLDEYEILITKPSLDNICEKYLNIKYIQSVTFPSHNPCIPYIEFGKDDPYEILCNKVSACPTCLKYMRFIYNSGSFIIQYADNIYILLNNTVISFYDGFLRINYSNISFFHQYESSYFSLYCLNGEAHVGTSFDIKTRKSLGRFVNSDNTDSTESENLLDEISMESVMRKLRLFINLLGKPIDIHDLIKQVYTEHLSEESYVAFNNLLDYKP